MPGQRDELLSKLADVVFGSAKKGRRRGSKTAWGAGRLALLGGLYYEEQFENPGLSDAEAARLIGKHPEFKHDDPDQIRQRLPLAREVHSEWTYQAYQDYRADTPTSLRIPTNRSCWTTPDF